MDQTWSGAAATQIVIVLLLLVARFLKLVLILNSRVMVLRWGYITRSLRIKSVLRLLCVHWFYGIRSVRRMDKGLRADGSRLDHGLVEILGRPVHVWATLVIEVVWILLQLLFGLIYRRGLVHLGGHLATDVPFLGGRREPRRILLANACVSHGLDRILARSCKFGGLDRWTIDDLATIRHLHKQLISRIRRVYWASYHTGWLKSHGRRFLLHALDLNVGAHDAR